MQEPPSLTLSSCCIKGTTVEFGAEATPHKGQEHNDHYKCHSSMKKAGFQRRGSHFLVWPGR